MFFNKVIGPQNSNFIKKKTSTQVFSCEICKIFKKTFFSQTIPSGCLCQFKVSSLQLFKKRYSSKDVFFCEFCKIFKNIFWQNTSGWLLLLFIWECLRRFSECLFYGAPLGNCLFHVQVAEFQQPETVKNNFINVFQAFYTRTTISHSKAFKF